MRGEDSDISAAFLFLSSRTSLFFLAFAGTQTNLPSSLSKCPLGCVSLHPWKDTMPRAWLTLVVVLNSTGMERASEIS